VLDKIQGLLFIILFWITLFVVFLLALFFKIIQLNKIQRFFRKKKQFSVLFLEIFPKENAGYYYRSAKWSSILQSEDIYTKVLNIFERDEMAKLFSTNRVIIFHLVFCCKRFLQCFVAFQYDIVIVRRELLMFNDYGNLFMERFLKSINNKCILDFDDNISAAKNEPRKISLYGKIMLEAPAKFIQSIKFYNYFTPGSNYLKQRFLAEDNRINPSNTLVLPTLVDYNHYRPKKYSAKKIISFGWIGSQTNYSYLPIVIEPLQRLSEKYDLEFIIIGDKSFTYHTGFDIKQFQWTLKDEIELLHKIDIGLMPLTDNEVSRGKCGFKLIQYMGCGIVSVASAVTVNTEIIDDKVNGFLVQNESQWYEILEEVINCKDSFNEIGQKAFKKISDNYSFDIYTKKYIDFLNFVNKNS
jgi:glycosyltransferase involved in cell wall biosynthesis